MRAVDLYGYQVNIGAAAVNDYVFDGCEKRNWKPELYALLDRVLRPELTFVDLGAFVGSVTLYAATVCRRVLAVECDPVCAAALRENVALNPELAGRIKILETAVAATAGPVQFGQRGGPGSGVGGLNFSDGQCAELEVPARTLSELIETEQVRPPYFLKVNLQGSEGRVLWAARGTLRRDLPTVHVYVRPENWTEEEDTEELISALRIFQDVDLEDGTPFWPDQIRAERWFGRHDYKLVAHAEDPGR